MPAPPDRPGPDPWARFRSNTRARIGIGRAGDALPTHASLAFQLAHARARDAVHGAADFAAIAQAAAPHPVLEVHSAAPDRPTYLLRPDLGRRLSAASRESLTPGGYDCVFVVADGLSAAAVSAHAAPMFAAARQALRGWHIAPLVLARQARVALGDEVGEALGAAFTVLLVGERPGLSVQDSLGIYLTYAPRAGRADSERNCISNIHPHGLGYAQAAAKLAWLMNQARTLGQTGVALKDEADMGALLAQGGAP